MVIRMFEDPLHESWCDLIKLLLLSACNLLNPLSVWECSFLWSSLTTGFAYMLRQFLTQVGPKCSCLFTVTSINWLLYSSFLFPQSPHLLYCYDIEIWKLKHPLNAFVLVIFTRQLRTSSPEFEFFSTNYSTLPWNATDIESCLE